MKKIICDKEKICVICSRNKRMDNENDGESYIFGLKAASIYAKAKKAKTTLVIDTKTNTGRNIRYHTT